MKTSELKIYVVARPTFEGHGILEFLRDRQLQWKQDESATDAEKVVEVAGRVCYLSFSEDTSKVRYPNARYILNLLSKGHESVLEHVSWTFLLDGISRAFTHQLVRHRVGLAFSQLSQQYHDESDATFVVPFGLKSDGDEYRAWEAALDALHTTYKALLKEPPTKGPDAKRERLRWVRSVARSLLPNATSTTLVMSGNARALRHLFAVRGTIEGDYEMRDVCSRLLSIVSRDAPSLFPDFRVEEHADGRDIVRCDITH